MLKIRAKINYDRGPFDPMCLATVGAKLGHPPETPLDCVYLAAAFRGVDRAAWRHALENWGCGHTGGLEHSTNEGEWGPEVLYPGDK